MYTFRDALNFVICRHQRKPRILALGEYKRIHNTLSLYKYDVKSTPQVN